MRKTILAIFATVFALPAASNWEYGDVYGDDGGRIVFGFRGGIAMPVAAKMRNDLGSIKSPYYYDAANDYIYNRPCVDCELIGEVDLGKLAPAEKYDSYAWAGGASVGVVLTNKPNVRMELDWLHIGESRYDAAPLFTGSAATKLGAVENMVATAGSTVSVDVVSAMFYYDFFEGMHRPADAMIPYIGMGLGYAVGKTALTLTDTYGDLSEDVGMQDFGDCAAAGDRTLCDFYTSETETNSFTLSAAAGLAYGIGNGIFLDFGARATYIPRIRWALNNNADENRTTTKERGVFSANDIIFVNIYAGVRFEF